MNKPSNKDEILKATGGGITVLMQYDINKKETEYFSLSHKY